MNIKAKDENLYEWEWSIHPGAFHDSTLDEAKLKNEKKYNLKISTVDLMLVDLLGNKLGQSRNTILSCIVDCVLQRWLLNLEDQDTRALIAKNADDDFDPFITDPNTPWTLKLFKDISSIALENSLTYSDSLISDMSDAKEESLVDYHNEMIERIRSAKATEDVEGARELQKELDKQLGRSESFDIIAKILKD